MHSWRPAIWLNRGRIPGKDLSLGILRKIERFDLVNLQHERPPILDKRSMDINILVNNHTLNDWSIAHACLHVHCKYYNLVSTKKNYFYDLHSSFCRAASFVRVLDVLIWENHFEPGGNVLKDQEMLKQRCLNFVYINYVTGI